MISTTLHVLLVYVQISVFGQGASPEPIVDSSMHAAGRPIRIQAIKAYDTAQACEDGLQRYAQDYGQKIKTGGVMRLRLKCETLQEFTFGDPAAPTGPAPANAR